MVDIIEKLSRKVKKLRMVIDSLLTQEEHKPPVLSVCDLRTIREICCDFHDWEIALSQLVAVDEYKNNVEEDEAEDDG